MTPGQDKMKAIGMLLLATFFWGTSFILMKALVLEQQKLTPEASSWHLTALSLVLRFGLAGMLLLLWNFRQLKKLTGLEFYQGAVLGIVGGLGVLFQMDGVNYTSASTAAFITQSYCIFIPLLVACRKREWPSRTVALSTAMVLIGVAILSQFDPRALKVPAEVDRTSMDAIVRSIFSRWRGEIETLIASLFFTAQILWLERPLFAKNNSHNITFVMFVVLALVFIPVPLSTGGFAMSVAAYSSWPAVVLILIITFFCTNIAYGLMNHWQPHVDATRAGLIYCSEPVFTSIFALFLPQWIALFALIDYPNETITRQQVFGGGLIVAANLIIIFQAARVIKKERERGLETVQHINSPVTFLGVVAETRLEAEWVDFDD
ncbi:MAG: DMT family transporter [Limisphaerales bacterium]